MTWAEAIRKPSTWGFLIGMFLIASEAILKVDELRFWGIRSDVIGLVICVGSAIAGGKQKERPPHCDSENA